METDGLYWCHDLWPRTGNGHPYPEQALAELDPSLKHDYIFPEDGFVDFGAFLFLHPMGFVDDSLHCTRSNSLVLYAEFNVRI